MAIIGYARISQDDQRLETQTDALRAAGCTIIHQETASGGDDKRPILRRVVASIRAGDTLIVVRLDRLARSLTHLLTVLDVLRREGAYFKSLGDPVDTTTPQGVFSLQVMAAVSELELGLLRERTKAGLRAARARGKIGGNPGLKSRDPAALAKLRAGRERRLANDDAAVAEEVMVVIRRMRPARRWDDVAATVNATSGPGTPKITPNRMRRMVRRLIAAGKASPDLLDRSDRPAVPLHPVVHIVAILYRQNPQISFRELGDQLQALGQKTPRGGSLQWNVSSVWNALKRARAAGLIPEVKAPQAAPKPPVHDLFTAAQPAV